MMNPSKQHKVRSTQVVVLAGGKGTRLLPYTTSFPKPLMPLGDRPILEIVLRQLCHAGFTDVILAVGHLSSLIEAYFGDGSGCGVRLSYLREDTPLGTAGPLAQLGNPAEHLLVMNGDILTDLDFTTFMKHHRTHGAAATIVTIAQQVPIEYGVLTTDEQGYIHSYEEKPKLTVEVSGGVYAFSRRALSCIPHDRRYDFPDLVLELLDRNEPVASYRHGGHWLDIGRRDDYEKATELFEENRGLFLPEHAAGIDSIPAGVTGAAVE
jgi:NDP-sugar pyrophosphorylase family protein